MFNFFSKSQQPAVEITKELLLGGKVIPITLRRSRKSRNLRLSVSRGKIKLTMPLRASEARAMQFATENQQWLARKLAEENEKPSYSFNFLDGSTAKYLGEDCQIVVSAGLRDYATLSSDESNGKRFNLKLKRYEEQRARKALTGFYKREARKLFEERVALHAAALQVQAGDIAIRGQTTKWGSCSKRGNLNFNWKLAMAPLYVIDYLIIHELSHLKHFNHSKAFWQTVEQFCPGHNTCEEWLEKNNNLLSF
ncbi:MAG: SprT family zinc-dependent metalloprotease [Candidatus Micrarchaeota archaeon]